MTDVGLAFYPLLIWYCATQNRKPWLYGFSEEDPKVKNKYVVLFLSVLFVIHTAYEIYYLIKITYPV